MNGQSGCDKEQWSLSQILVLVTPTTDQLVVLPEDKTQGTY